MSVFPHFFFKFYSFVGAGADSGLVVGGGANPWGGADPIYFYTISEKPYEIKEILDRRGGAPGAPPKSATEVHCKISISIQKILAIFANTIFLALKNEKSRVLSYT